MKSPDKIINDLVVLDVLEVVEDECVESRVVCSCLSVSGFWAGVLRDTCNFVLGRNFGSRSILSRRIFSLSLVAEVAGEQCAMFGKAGEWLLSWRGRSIDDGLNGAVIDSFFSS